MYTMHARVCKSEAHVAADSSGELWRKRQSHMSEKGIHLLADQKLLPEVKGVHLEKCVNCLVGKQNRFAPHSRPPKRREATLELAHTNVGYVDALLHRGGQYFVKFIGDYSRKLWNLTIGNGSV